LKIIVIIPTYNERQNIEKLIPELADHVFPAMKHDMGILVVDDNSPDQTAEAVREIMKRHPNVSLITGNKQGLGRAYIRGMQYALEHLGADAVMEMDADFSHKPGDVPRLVAALEDHDFVIGSRYVPGGKIPAEWPWLRKMNSKWGNIVVRYVAGMYRVRDCTAGFRAIKADVLRKIDFTTLEVDGYCFQISLLHRVIIGGARVGEVPVEFADRTVGESKLGIRDIVEFLIHVWEIRLSTSKTFICFLIVGASGLLVNLGSMAILLSFGMNKYLASPVSIEISIITNFLLNNFWTFAHRNNKSHVRIRGLKFNAVSFVALGVSYGTFILLSFLYPSQPPLLHQAIGVIPGTLINYFLNSYWTFKAPQKAGEPA
jgi:dolichol-phosphate mannosyltransferase